MDLEHLNMKKSQDFIKSKLLVDWIAHQLSVNIISYPISKHIVVRWMKEVGFRYETYNKVIMWIDMRIQKFLVIEELTLRFFVNEIYECCWV